MTYHIRIRNRDFRLGNWMLHSEHETIQAAADEAAKLPEIVDWALLPASVLADKRRTNYGEPVWHNEGVGPGGRD